MSDKFPFSIGDTISTEVGSTYLESKILDIKRLGFPSRNYIMIDIPWFKPPHQWWDPRNCELVEKAK